MSEPDIRTAIPVESPAQALARAVNDLEAAEARVERNARRVYDESRGKLVFELLPVLDNLDRTINVATDTTTDPVLLEGVRMVRAQLESVLLRYGVDPIDAAGQSFDPSIHEAISVTPVIDPARHNVVLHQAEAGFQFAGKLLRPAKVIVGKLARPAPDPAPPQPHQPHRPPQPPQPQRPQRPQRPSWR